jgi:hypothetical protein
MPRVAERAKTSTVDVGPAKSTHTSGSIDNDSDDGDDDAGALSLSQILALKEQFDASDTDGGGSLDIDEVPSDYTIEEMFTLISNLFGALALDK